MIASRWIYITYLGLNSLPPNLTVTGDEANQTVSMALLVAGGCVRVRPVGLSRPAQVRRKLTTFATVSPTPGDRVDWVEATSSFFEDDTRPIMLFDGKVDHFST